MTTDPNDDQAAAWNGETGAKWVALAEPLGALTAEVQDLLLARAAPRAGERVLDLGCGGGGLSLALGRAVGPGGGVLGLDVSAPLLALAEARRRAAGAANVAFRHGDAAEADLPAASFDLLASLFGAMFFADPVAAFRTLGRALRPGGRVALAAWGPASENPFFRRPRAAALEVLGPVPAVPASPDAPGPFAFADGARVEGLLAAAGYEGAACEAADVALRAPGGLDALTDLMMQVGPVPGLLRAADAPPGVVAEVRAAVRAALQPFDGPDGPLIPARINLFAAARP